ncbi:MAG: insulinase family protein, partial [Chromatiales bacterium]|nr:insulinase family protein [Chromatiales bacterium]
DPFFMMTRRSLNTFMNAFTSSDWTAYPFASQNRKDFDNLLQVYLDAAFFPRLDELDFLQEGHRVEFENPDDPESPLVYKGVVYNEMKGAMSAPTQTLWQAVHSRLFPTVTYHYNSGGDPMHIPELSYTQLKAFHARHYHPSNALFFTYGDFPVEEHQARMDELALSRFDALEIDLHVPDEQRYSRPVEAQERYAIGTDESTEGKTHVVLAWLLGAITDLREAMNVHLLSSVLLDNSASPLRHALETCGLGASPSELCGVDDSTREMGFFAGMEGTDQEQADAVESLILETLERLAEEGIPQDQVDAMLHQIELSQREITGGHFPYGLHLIVNALGPAIHGGDPVAALDVDAVLEELRADTRDPQFVKELIRRLLLENPHRVRLVMTPDPQLAEEQSRQERVRLDAMRAAMDELGRNKVIEQTQALRQRQETDDDPGVLPKVGLEDVAEELKIAEGEHWEVAGIPTEWYSQGTNGMVYQQLVVDLPQMDEDLVDVLSLYATCLTELGAGDRDYLSAQAWQASVTGGVGARVSVRGEVDDVNSTRGVFVLFGKALARNQGALGRTLQEIYAAARFDEPERLRELVAQLRSATEAGLTSRGHVYAIQAAAAPLSPASAINQRWSGLAGVKALKSLDKSLQNAQGMDDLIGRFRRIHSALLSAPRRLLLIGEQARAAEVRAAAEEIWSSLPGASVDYRRFLPPQTGNAVAQQWTTSAQVNFCARAYATVPMGHPDAPALMVLGEFLRNGFLHTEVREKGGAYGSGASWDSDSGTFRFYSYRDPRLGETLADFDRALAWLRSDDPSERECEEAVLGVVSSIDRPESPSGEAVSAFFASLFGRSPDVRRAFRARVLAVTLEELKAVGERWLKPENASTAVLSDAGQKEAGKALGLETIAL